MTIIINPGLDASPNGNNWTPNYFSFQTNTLAFTGGDISGMFNGNPSTGGTPGGITGTFVTPLSYNKLLVVYGNMANGALGNPASGATLSINGSTVSATGTYSDYGWNSNYAKYYQTTTPGTLTSIGISPDVSGSYGATLSKLWIDDVLIAYNAYDSMTDVPTLTSATAANYCTLSPIWKNTNHTTSNGNLTVTSSSYGACGPTMGVTTGKWYHEATISNRTSNNSGSIGFCNELFNIPGALFFPENTNGFGVNAINGDAYSGSGTSYGTAFASGDVIMIAFDADAKKMWVGKNGTWFASGNPVAGTNQWPLTITGSTFFPCVNCYGDTYQYNFGQQPFQYTPPTGFVALNTYNL